MPPVSEEELPCENDRAGLGNSRGTKCTSVARICLIEEGAQVKAEEDTIMVPTEEDELAGME